MPLQATSGAASYDALGGGVAVVPNYIEDVFSTYLYTGNNTTRTITNGIDLAGKGGLVWIKRRSTAEHHHLSNTNSGPLKFLCSNKTDQEFTDSNGISSFNSDGFTEGNRGDINALNETYASWTFREQPKFFDVVTWTGNGATYRDITTGFSNCGTIIAKCTSGTGDWWVWHRTFGSDTYLKLNTTAASSSANSPLFGSETGGTFGVAIQGSNSLNTNGATYVAYLFAHNAGGFGLTGTDNVISCGSYTGNGTNGNTVTLNYEPQFLMVKKTNASGGWWMIDTMRGFTVTADSWLFANSANAETNASSGFSVVDPTSTGFSLTSDAGLNNSGDTYIYIAIRRGPMKVPTTGTSVLGLSARTGTGANVTVTGNAGVTDLAIIKNSLSASNWVWASRLTGTRYLSSNANTAETAAGTTILQANPWDVMDGVKVGSTSNLTNEINNGYINYLIDRAPGFFDQVFYTGTGTGNPRALSHNLTVVPELIIVKRRSDTQNWYAYGNALGANNYLELNTNRVLNPDGPAGTFTPATSTTFCPEDGLGLNNGSPTYVAHLFASCPGVSKLGSYTGNGSSQTIDCGFTGGARFVLIRATSTTGDWVVFDSARGITSGNDPALTFNTNQAEFSGADMIDPASSGFIVNNVGGVNTSGVSYIFLAIA